MSVEELDQYLKSQNIESIDSKELLQTILGVKVFDVKDTDKKISQLRESILDSATKAASKIKNNVENIDQKKAVSDLLGIPVEEVDSTPLNILRKDLLSKVFENFNQIKNELTANKESFNSNITDPFGMSDNSGSKKEYRNKLSEIWENMKKNIGGSSENLISKLSVPETPMVSTGFNTNNNTALSDLVKKLYDFEKSKRIPTIDILSKNVSLIVTKIDEIIKNQLDTPTEKGQTQELYEVGPKKFRLDEDSVIRIAKELNLSSEDQKKLLSALVSETRETRGEFGKLSSFLTQKGNGLVDILFDLAALTATGVLGLLFGKGILKLADSIFGTDLVGLFESITDPLKKFGGYITDGMKALISFSVILMNITNGATNILTKGLGNVLNGLMEAGKSIRLVPKFVSSSFSKMTSGLFGAGKLAGAVGTTAVAASETATGATKALGAVGAAEGAVASGATKLLSKAGLGFLFKGALGAVFRKIPLIGAFIDAGAAISNFMSGDMIGGTLRTIGALGNIFSMVPGLGIVGFGVSLLADFLDDAMTEEAGGDVTKKNTNVFATMSKIISGWGESIWKWITKKVKSILGFSTDEEESAEPKPMEPEISTSSSKVVEKAKEISSSKTQTESTESNEIDKMSAATGINFRDLSKMNLNPMSIPSAPQLNVNDIAKSSQYSISMPESIGINNSSMQGLMDMISNSMGQIMPSQPVSIAGGGGNANMTDMFIHGSRDPIYDTRSDWWGVLNKRKW
jgi:hypothetical protein